jgi:hypothetical protein
MQGVGELAVVDRQILGTSTKRPVSGSNADPATVGRPFSSGESSV